MKKEFEVISQIIQNNKRVLDIGCGDGTLMEYLKIKQQNDEKRNKLIRGCLLTLLLPSSKTLGTSSGA